MKHESVIVKIPKSVVPLLNRIGRLADAQGRSAYAVGGCVRDWTLGDARTPDLDVTVEGDGVAVARAVARVLGGTVRVHDQFGTATIMLAGPRTRRVDVASCRKETYARPAAYPKVTRGTLKEDLFRRDFTINAMAVAINPGRLGTLVDPFGGAQDLRQRRLRVLHQQSLLDDPTRILRGIRFAVRFDCGFDRTTDRLLLEALAAGALGWLNAGRLNRELARMLEEPDPYVCFRQLAVLLDKAG